MRSLRSNGLLSAFLILQLAFVLAHEGHLEHQLGGSLLCLDPGSVLVEIRADGRNDDARLETLVYERLLRSLQTILVNYQVPYRWRAECRGEDAVVSTSFVVSYLTEGPDRGRYDYRLSLSVGHDEQDVDSPTLFEMGLSSLASDAELDSPFFIALPRFNEAMMKDVAMAWWSANPLPSPTRSARVRVLGVLLAVLSGSLSWLALSRHDGNFSVRTFVTKIRRRSRI